MKVRSLNVIASEIITDFEKEYKERKAKHLETGKGKMPVYWKQKYVHALAYVEPMQCMISINEMYMCDSGKSVVAYALGNLTTWRGETAKRIKKELNGMLK
jgi:hypothetical protein